MVVHATAVVGEVVTGEAGNLERKCFSLGRKGIFGI